MARFKRANLRGRPLALLAAGLLLLSVAAQAQAPAVVYRITTQKLANHILRVEADIPPAAFPDQERILALPVWTPGSYKVRDYSRFLRQLELKTDGGTLEKISKNSWRVTGVGPEASIKISYEVYGHELTVRTNYFSPDLSLITGAGLFIAPAPLQSDRMVRIPYRVIFPDEKRPVYTALPGHNNAFNASDYDELLDCPFLWGEVEHNAFQAGGLPHTLLQAGDVRYWDLDKSLKDLKTLVETQQAFWGQTPYQTYHFMNLVTDTRGGLEHRNSTVMMTSRFATEERDSYLKWLALVSHEYFHTWNVKRLYPTALGSFDYEDEIYTRSLWVAEGITSYYDDLMVRRAGLSTDKEYLKALSSQLNHLYQTPGRLALPLTSASWDAWIRLYQPTEDTINSSISYYNKGAVVAWLLDSEIRRLTEGRKSLDDVMVAAYARFSEKGFSEDQFRQLCQDVTGLDLTDFFALTLDSTEELELEPALAYWGLSWEAKDSKASEEPYLGLTAKNEEGRLLVKEVMADSPAASAGVAPGDELLALDGVRVPTDDLSPALKSLKQGRSYPLLVARLGRLQTLNVTLSAPPFHEHSLKVKKKEAPYEARREAWFGKGKQP